MTELVVLLDAAGIPIGSADKATVHTADTPLHLAFSCHVRNRRGQVLVTRRALSKSAWPGIWTNAFCGHPAPGELLTDAVARRARDELGLRVYDARVVLPDFRYEAVDVNGIRENEVCPVFEAVTDDEPQAHPDEVADYRWVESADLDAALAHAPWAFSPWLVWQAEQLAQRSEGQRITERGASR